MPKPAKRKDHHSGDCEADGLPPLRARFAKPKAGEDAEQAGSDRRKGAQHSLWVVVAVVLAAPEVEFVEVVREIVALGVVAGSEAGNRHESKQRPVAEKKGDGGRNESPRFQPDEKQ